MEKKIGFFEKQYAKNEAEYCKKYGRRKFLEVNSKNFKHFLLLVIASFVTSVGSLLSAVFYPIEYFGVFDVWVRVLWYSGFGVFLLSAIVLSIRLPLYRRKSKEHKNELLKYNEIEK